MPASKYHDGTALLTRPWLSRYNHAMRIGGVLESPANHSRLRVLLLAVAAALLVQTYGKAIRADGYDFRAYLQSASALASGADPYRTDTPFPYLYPLLLALALVPLTKVPYVAAVGLWFIGGAVCACVSAQIAASLAAGKESRPLAIGVSLVVLLGMLDPIQSTLLNGQVNFEVLLLCLLFFYEYEKGRRFPASACLALAIGLKIVPLVLAGSLALRREWRILTAALLGAAALCLLPAVLAGRRIFELYARYGREFLVARARPASGAGLIFFTPYGFIGWLFPSLDGAAWVRYGAVALVLAGAALYQLRRRGALDFRLFCLSLVLIPFLSPMSEVHHLIFAMPASILLSTEALNRRPRPGAIVVAGAALFWCCLWMGRLDRYGPFYFAALASLVIGLAGGGRIDSGRMTGLWKSPQENSAG